MTDKNDKDAAMLAGFNLAKGDAALFFNDDLNDPPELITEMIYGWQIGYDIVNMQRRYHSYESVIKRFSNRTYYSYLKHSRGTSVFTQHNNFNLIGSKALSSIRNLENNNMLSGFINWQGFNVVDISYSHKASRIDLAKRIFSVFSKKENDSESSSKILRFFTLSSTCMFVLSLLNIAVSLVQGEANADQLLPLAISLLFVGIALANEYLARKLIAIQRAPLYLVEKEQNRFMNVRKPKKEKHQSIHFAKAS